MSESAGQSGQPDWVAQHIELYRKDPERGHHWDSSAVGGPGVLPVLLLETTGRKSGRTRTSPLIYTTTDTGWVVIASKGGAPSHPAWYLNLVDEPECEIQVAHERTRVRARVAEGEERKRLWRAMAEIYPPYDDYQVAAGDRQIPVVVLEPVDA